MRERERAAALIVRGEGRECVRKRKRDSKEMIYRKLPRSPKSHYKHWAIACMRPTSCAAKEHVSPKRTSDSREGSFSRKGGEKFSKAAGDGKSIHSPTMISLQSSENFHERFRMSYLITQQSISSHLHD